MSALLPPGLFLRYGGVRALQNMLAATAAMLLLAAGGSVRWLAFAAVALGLGYGAAPASTHLLVPHTPRRGLHGDVAAADRRAARWRAGLIAAAGSRPCRLARRTDAPHMGFDLVGAGRALALYQITGAASRPIWGWIADRWIAPGQTRAVHGFGMAAAAVAAGAFGPHWNRAAVLAAVSLAGCPPAATPASPPSRWHAAQRGHRLGTAVMFAGVLLIPPCFGLGVAASGSHAPAYCVPAALASASAVLLCLDRWTRRAAAPA